MNITYTFSFLSAWLMLSIAACGSSHQAEDNDADTRVYVEAPAFDADSAYLYVKKQVEVRQRRELVGFEIAAEVLVVGQREDGRVVREKGRDHAERSGAGHAEDRTHQRLEQTVQQ